MREGAPRLVHVVVESVAFDLVLHHPLGQDLSGLVDDASCRPREEKRSALIVYIDPQLHATVAAAMACAISRCVVVVPTII